jgi:hypothetical protein
LRPALSLHRFAPTWLTSVAAVVAVAGLAARIVQARSRLGVPDSDEAVWGLMARHTLHGEFSTFFWNQAYGGTQEVFLTAPVFAAFGAGLFTLRVVPFALNVVAALIVWRVGRRTIGEPAASVAALVYWLWPPFTFWELGHQYGFYASGVVYSTLTLLLALRVRERPTAGRVGALGFVVGLAFWQTAQIVPIAVGAVLWLLWKQPRACRYIWVAAPLAALGALPWIVWNARHNWASRHFTGGSTSLVGRARGLVDSVLPMALGLRVPFTSEWLIPAAMAGAIYAGLIGLFAYGALRSRHRDVSLLYVVTAVFLFFFPFSSKTFATDSPRYLTILMPVLALLVAPVARNLRRTIPLLTLLGIVSALVLAKMVDWQKPPAVDNTPLSFAPLIRELDELHIDRVYADYWIAYRLDFATRERIIAVEGDFGRLAVRNGQLLPPPLGSNVIRHPPYDAEVRNARHAYVFLKLTVAHLHLAGQLERHGFSPHPVGEFLVFAPE